jgi:uncharacterized protein involved in outer membrane biogenesis
LKRILIAISVIWAVIAIGVLVTPRVSALVDYRAALIEQIEARTGRKASIDGKVTLDLFPSTEISAENVRVASIPGAPSADVIRTRRAVFKVDRWSLLSRKLRITGIVLDEPKIYLDVLPDGGQSWRFTPVRKPGKQRKLMIDAFRAKNATLFYRKGEAQTMLTGDLSYEGTGARPRVEASLKGGTIDTNQFLPPRDSGPDKVRDGGIRWSEAPIDLAAWRGVDGKIEISAGELRYRRYVFDKPALRATLDNGQMRIETASAGLFGGQALIKGSIDARATPAVKLDVSLKDASLETALKDWADTPFANGTISMTAALTAAGDTQYAMITSLAGTALIEAKSGIVRGFDAARLSGELTSLRRYSDFIDLADAVLSGGQTSYSRIGGGLRFKSGVATLHDFTASLDAARATAQGSVNLPRWSVNLDVSLRLTAAELTGAPSVGLSLAGPLETPRQKIRLSEMGKFVGKKLADTVIRDVLGDRDPSYEDAAPGERRATTKRVLNRLIDKLDKKRGRRGEVPRERERPYGGDSAYGDEGEPGGDYRDERGPDGGYQDNPDAGGYYPDEPAPQGGYRDYEGPDGRY